jgi:hypothetical protein
VPCIRVTKEGSSKDNFKRYLRVLLKRFSHCHAHTLRPRREWASSDDLHLQVPIGSPDLIGLDLPLIALIGVTGRRRKNLTCTQTRNNKSKA